MGFLLLNSRLFRWNKIIATILPIAFSLTFILTAIQFVGGLDNIKKLCTQINSKHDTSVEQNQLCCGFTKDSTNIYYNGTILKKC